MDSWVLERLMRQAWMFFQPRSGGGYWNQPYAFTGHLVVLADQATCRWSSTYIAAPFWQKSGRTSGRTPGHTSVLIRSAVRLTR